MGKAVKTVGKWGAAVATGGASALAEKKFVQTTWNRLNGDGKKKRSGGSSGGGAVAVEGSGDSGLEGGGGSGADALDGALTEAKRRRSSTLIGLGAGEYGGGALSGSLG